MDARKQIVHELLGKRVHVEVDRPIGYRHGEMVCFKWVKAEELKNYLFADTVAVCAQLRGQSIT